MPLEVGPAFEQLLEFLRQNRGFDFTGYKRTTLVRRVGKRAQQVGVDDFADYLDYLQVHPDEFPILFNAILINVTEFFRDKAAWDYLAEELVPRIAAKAEDEPIRVWSAACASGEEAYSAAMLFCEALGEERYQERVKVYATDVDEEALAAARAGYPAEALAPVPEALRKKYFDLQGGRYVFKPAFRRTIIFGRHDLLQDAPISKVDLLICRNTLMYFTAESQARILARFHYALREDGFLFLGRAEMLLTHTDLFLPVELKHRLFSKVQRVNAGERLALLLPGAGLDSLDTSTTSPVRSLAIESLPVPAVLLDSQQLLVAANQAARSLFRIAHLDIGRPLKDLELSYRPLELRSRIAAAGRERKPVVVREVEHRAVDGPPATLEVHVTPLVDEGAVVVGTSILFFDVTEPRRLAADLERVRQEVETANEELQSSYEELETTNEELQSTVEELETTNEELQSSNEELETMNEELESTNAELQTINSDLRQRTEDVDRLNIFLDAILTGLHVGITVLDADLKVAMWNARSREIWGLDAGEAVGAGFFELDAGLPFDELRQPIRDVMAGRLDEFIKVVPAVNRRGRTIECRVSVTPLSRGGVGGTGVVVLMEDLKGAGPPS